MATFKKHEKNYYWIFVLPVIVIYSVIVVFPILNTFTKSVTIWDGINTPQFVGLKHYLHLFRSKDLYLSTKNSLIWGVSLFVYQLGLGTFFAFIFNQYEIKGKKLFKILYFIPVILSATVVCQLWLFIFHGQFGLLNKIFEHLGFQYRQDWLSMPNTSIYPVILTDAWKGMGYHMIIIYAAMQTISKSYYEAARIEGISPFQSFTLITLPLLKNIYRFLIILVVSYGFRVFEFVYIMTGGGPAKSSYTSTMLLYKSVFNYDKFGYGSAIAVIIVIECILVMAILNKIIPSDNVEF